MKVCPTCNNQFADDQKFCPNDGSGLRSAGGSADLVGSIIGGKYHIKKKLGEGGMGAVYLGEHVKMNRKSAIKVMTQSMAHDTDAIARFNREATNAAQINHPNVCAIYDFGETPEGLIYLAMEFIEGGSLSSVIEAEGALQPARAARIIQQAGDALAAAHELGIVHRDLKPDNIMITRGRDGGDMVKVVDFGIAKAVGGSEEGQKVTKTGLVVGTPEYMSPEQLSGDKLDGRSDIYSLALVFYRMLTGTLPFQADSAQETMIKRLTDDPMPLNEAMPGANFPPRLQKVMDKALARMPADRYGSAADFARDGARALEGVVQGSITEGATQLIDTAKTAQIAQTRVSTGKGAGKTAIRTPETPMPRPSLPVPAPKKGSSKVLVASVVGVLVVGGGSFAAWKVFGGSASGTPGTDQPRVTDNTAKKQANRNPGSTRNPTGTQTQTDSPGGQTGNPQNPTSTTRIDSAGINAELGRLLDDLDAGDAAKLDPVRTRALDIFSNAAMPKNLRAEAAFLISNVYQTRQDAVEACMWLGKALGQQPGWSVAEKTKQRLGCQ